MALVLVNYLDTSISPSSLRKTFSSITCGQVLKVDKILRSRRDVKAVAIVQFENEEQAGSAVLLMDEALVGKMNVAVRMLSEEEKDDLLSLESNNYSVESWVSPELDTLEDSSDTLDWSAQMDDDHDQWALISMCQEIPETNSSDHHSLHSRGNDQDHLLNHDEEAELEELNRSVLADLQKSFLGQSTTNSNGQQHHSSSSSSSSSSTAPSIDDILGQHLHSSFTAEQLGPFGLPLRQEQVQVQSQLQPQPPLQPQGQTQPQPPQGQPQPPLQPQGQPQPQPQPQNQENPQSTPLAWKGFVSHGFNAAMDFMINAQVTSDWGKLFVERLKIKFPSIDCTPTVQHIDSQFQSQWRDPSGVENEASRHRIALCWAVFDILLNRMTRAYPPEELESQSLLTKLCQLGEWTNRNIKLYNKTNLLDVLPHITPDSPQEPWLKWDSLSVNADPSLEEEEAQSLVEQEIIKRIFERAAREGSMPKTINHLARFHSHIKFICTTNMEVYALKRSFIQGNWPYETFVSNKIAGTHAKALQEDLGKISENCNGCSLM